MDRKTTRRYLEINVITRSQKHYTSQIALLNEFKERLPGEYVERQKQLCREEAHFIGNINIVADRLREDDEKE